MYKVEGGRDAGSSSPAGCIHLSCSEVDLTRESPLQRSHVGTDSECLGYLLMAGSTYPLSPEPQGRTGGEHVGGHTIQSALTGNRGQVNTALLQICLRPL